MNDIHKITLLPVMKNTLVSLVFLANCIATPNLSAQKTMNTEPITAAQLMPLLRLYDLAGIATLAKKPSHLSGVERPIDLNQVWVGGLPFDRISVDNKSVSLKTSDNSYYVVCPFPPPTLTQLASARTFHECVEAMIPATRSEFEELRMKMEVPSSEQTLLEMRDGFNLELRAAYIHDDRLVWIKCTLSYPSSTQPRSIHSPFDESAINVSASPKYR